MNGDITKKAIGGVMQTDVVTIDMYSPVSEAVKILEDNSFHHIPVMDDQDKLVGMLSQTDIDKISWGKSLFQTEKREDLNTSVYESWLVKDIMTRNVHFLYDDQTVGQAIKIFYGGKFHALPIISDGNVVGIITPQDILNLLL